MVRLKQYIKNVLTKSTKMNNISISPTISEYIKQVSFCEGKNKWKPQTGISPLMNKYFLVDVPENEWMILMTGKQIL